MSELSDSHLLDVKILSPESVLYEGQARFLTCINKAGPFDILPYHSNFISLIYQSITVFPVSKEPQVIPIGYALLKCLSDSITILTNVDISSYSQLLTLPKQPSAVESK